MWVAAIVLYLIYRSKVGPDEARSMIGKIFGGYIGLCVLLGLVVAEPGILVLPLIGLIIWLFVRKQKQAEEQARKEEYGWTEMGTPGDYYHEKAKIRKDKSSQTAGKIFSTILPKNVAKRRRIIEKFNRVYKLFLTDDQIESIVNSSYMSERWKREVEAMTEEYDVPSQWMMGETRWLRAYLYSFTRQDVTYDFKQQEQIALTAFEQVMRYSDSLGALPLSDRIDRINSRYFTQFNDVTFMIAYRFLEDKGIHHELETFVPDMSDNPIDDLAKKYQQVEV